MCLVVKKNQRPLVAEKDIVVYKSVEWRNYKYVSPFHGFVYEKKQYKTRMCSSIERWAFDDIETEVVRKLYGPMRNANIKFIGKGFHFAFSRKRLEHAAGGYIMRCIIPKGTKYYVGIDTTLGVAEKIIVKSFKPQIWKKTEEFSGV